MDVLSVLTICLLTFISMLSAYIYDFLPESFLAIETRLAYVQGKPEMPEC